MGDYSERSLPVVFCAVVPYGMWSPSPLQPAHRKPQEADFGELFRLMLEYQGKNQSLQVVSSLNVIGISTVESKARPLLMLCLNA